MVNIQRLLTPFLCICAAALWSVPGHADSPVRIAVAGLTHGHVEGFLYEVTHRAGFELVGVAETQRQPIDRYFQKFGIDYGILASDVSELISRFHPDAIAIYGATTD